MIHYCPNCGTEVDETAAFCPTCGQPLDEVREDGQAAAPDAGAPAQPADQPFLSQRGPAAPDSDAVAPTRAHGAAPPPPAVAGAPSSPQTSPLPRVELPITWPVMLSGWLIGIGAIVAALGLVVIFFRHLNPIDLVLLLLLLLIAATVFLSASLPAVPHQRLATLAVGLIGLGVALDRIGVGTADLGALLLFLGTAGVSAGALLAEAGRDRPMATPGRTT
ncbi:MAG: zinc ribbon domain-containing protein [Chloroflexota bacterium]|nr:zinc ribbon domain-containing protein [Chloroflexota bacterium]